jgi:hypothetical protein
MRDWDNIRIFLGVCRHGSLAAAARALKVDETTVGRRVKAPDSHSARCCSIAPHKVDGR